MKLKTLIIVVVMVVSSVMALPLMAASPTPVPEASGSADLRSKLKSLQEQVASRAASLKAEISQKLQNKAYVGIVKVKSDSSLQLASQGGSRIVTINQDTEYVGKNKFSPKTLQVDDYVAALGDVDDNQVITARRLYRLDTPKEGTSPSSRAVVFGQVISTTKQTVTVRTPSEQTITITTNEDTSYKYGKQTGDITQIKTNKNIIIVGSLPKDDAMEARFIYIQPYSAAIKTKEASPSAAPTTKPTTPTPSKKPTPTPKK